MIAAVEEPEGQRANCMARESKGLRGIQKGGVEEVADNSSLHDSGKHWSDRDRAAARGGGEPGAPKGGRKSHAYVGQVSWREDGGRKNGTLARGANLFSYGPG